MFKTGPRCCIVQPGFRTASPQDANPLASLILRIQRGRRGLLQIQTTPRRSCKTPCKCDNIFASVAQGRLQEGMHSSPGAGGGAPGNRHLGRSGLSWREATRQKEQVRRQGVRGWQVLGDPRGLQEMGRSLWRKKVIGGRTATRLCPAQGQVQACVLRPGASRCFTAGASGQFLVLNSYPLYDADGDSARLGKIGGVSLQLRVWTERGVWERGWASLYLKCGRHFFVNDRVSGAKEDGSPVRGPSRE